MMQKKGMHIISKEGQAYPAKGQRSHREAKIIVDFKLGGGCSGSEMKLLGFFRFGGAKNES